MRSKNAIKIKNIQKFYPVHFHPIWSIKFSSVHFGSIRSTLVLFSSFCPLRSYSVNIGPIWFNSVLFGHICSYMVHYVHFGPNLSICSYSVPINPSVHISPLCLFCPLRSYTVHFSPIWSTSILFGPVWSTLFPFNPIVSIRSTSFHLVQFNPFVSTALDSDHFGSFLCTYI